MRAAEGSTTGASFLGTVGELDALLLSGEGGVGNSLLRADIGLEGLSFRTKPGSL